MMDRLSSFDGRFAAQSAQGYGKPGLNAQRLAAPQNDLIAQSNQRLAALREHAKATQAAKSGSQPLNKNDFKAAFNATLSMAVQELAKDTGLAAPMAAVKSVAEPVMEALPAAAPAIYRQPSPTRLDVAPTPQSKTAQPLSQARSLVQSSERLVQNTERVINDVLAIAKKTGFVGVNPEDVRRAYQTGQSFLADYKV